MKSYVYYHPKTNAIGILTIGSFMNIFEMVGKSGPIILGVWLDEWEQIGKL